MNSANIQSQAIPAMRVEAARLKKEFREYLEDLELFSDPEFWKAIEETQKGKGKKFSSIKELIHDLDA